MYEKKSTQVCPNKLLVMIPASELSHTDCTCLILALHRLAQLRCLPISWLDRRRLQANKLRARMSNQTSPDCRLLSRYFSVLNLVTWYWLPRNGNHSHSTSDFFFRLFPIRMRSSACSIPGILVCISHSNEDSRRLIIVSTCQFCQGRTSVTFVDNMPIVVSRSTTWYAISLLIRRLRCTLVNACSISTGKVELCVGRPTRKNYVIAYIFTEMTIISFIYGVTDCPYGHQEPEVRCAPRRGPRSRAWYRAKNSGVYDIYIYPLWRFIGYPLDLAGSLIGIL